MQTPDQIQAAKSDIIAGFNRREIRDARMTAEVVEPAKEAVVAFARTQADPSKFLLQIAAEMLSEDEAKLIELMLTASHQHMVGYREEAYLTSDELVETASTIRDRYEAAMNENVSWAAE